MDTNLLGLSHGTQLAASFGAGLISSLTPCVYPLIPVTLALLGANADAPRSRAFLLSLVYVLGISTTFTMLGLICAKTGATFGSHLGNPYIVALIGVVLVVLALSTLEIININFFSKIQNKAGGIGGKGYRGSYLMGLVSGFVAAPCVGPVLAGILIVAAKSESPIWGGVLLLAYSLGLGVLFILLGTFAGLTKKIPRSGNWLYTVKLLIASMLFLFAFFFMGAIIKAPFLPVAITSNLLLVIVLLGVGLVVGQLALMKDLKLLKLICAVFLGLISYQSFVPGANFTKESKGVAQVAWLNKLEDAVTNAHSKGTVAMVDLYADWCNACKEFEHQTFSNANVQSALSKISTGRIDFTSTTEYTASIQERYGVVGLPSILFLDGDGNEIPDSRVTGFLSPSEFLEHLKHFAGTKI